MKRDLETELETRIDRELKRLPELPAPPALLPRVLAVLGRQAVRPWYRRAWQTWPLGLQVASFAVLAAMFAWLCYAGWELSRLISLTEATQTFQQPLAAFSVVGSTLSVIGQALVLVVKHLGWLCLAACALMSMASYISCLGLGTAFVRLAVVRRPPAIRS